MEILGYFGALAIGIVLGLTGGGGSLLTVPILVYILHIEPVVATAYSLFVVGATSSIGSYKNYKLGNVDIQKGLLFAVPSLIGVFLAQAFLVPLLPDIIFKSTAIEITKGSFLMIFFSIIMLLAAYSMLRKRKNVVKSKEISRFHFIAQNFVIGIIIGFVGAGGGFLIIPSLVLLVNFPIRKAIGTSLFIITLNSLIGFLGALGNITIDWVFLLKFSLLSILGIFLGMEIGKKSNERLLKKVFAYFVLFMALIILVKEIL